MASNYIPSIFHNRSNKKDTTSLLSKRATISSAKQLEELPPLQRSNTTLSKVKRFGSLLVRNKKSENTRTRADSIFPPSIDTTPCSNYSLSTTSTHNVSTSSSSSDEDEEHVVTPTTTSSSPSHIFELPSLNHQPAVNGQQQQYHNSDIIPVEPEIETNQDLAEKDVISETNTSSVLIEEPETIIPTVTIVDPETLSGVSLVRYHLDLAAKEVDEAIDDELDFHRQQMLQNIRTTPTFLF
ncbi:hypothetical protein EDC94DRAFT_602872 [Helicostylum pulchrum]|uniref:Uncharacterized protein n=1 Tax=Helicostylum pulchrum TaxID=562976 RepID=A0ABP9YFH5_9FUNG|nr:hypothetical protein EDC94DRAFT_602872 [Helicostylum pulchrum]